MKIIPYGTQKYAPPCILLLGYFDAMHVGHRALAARAKEVAAGAGLRVGIMTFTGAKNGGQVFVYEERLTIFRSLGLDFVYPADFSDPAFRSLSGEAFLRHVLSQLNVKAFVCGEDFTYGRGAECGAKELRRFGEENGIDVYVEPLVCPGGEKAASAEAKALLDRGDIPALEKLLGGRYFIEGKVSTEGRHVGSRIGFPTANIHLSAQKYPLREGVYAVSAKIGRKVYRGIANYGDRPTFGDGRVIFETYFLGYKGDLYGKELTVYFDFFIREIQKFHSAGELAAQLKKDLEKIQ